MECKECVMIEVSEYVRAYVRTFLSVVNIGNNGNIGNIDNFGQFN